MANSNITADRLREMLDYDRNTGVFKWKINRTVRKSGDVAGFLTMYGYVSIGLDGFVVMAHRLAWIYVHGTAPVGSIDHINGNRKDNRIVNLRDVTHCVNTQNVRKVRSNNTSGLLGVSSSASKSKPWKASITVNGKTRYIGIYKTKEDAHSAYVKEKRSLHSGCTL